VAMATDQQPAAPAASSGALAAGSDGQWPVASGQQQPAGGLSGERGMEKGKYVQCAEARGQKGHAHETMLLYYPVIHAINNNQQRTQLQAVR
jgi:hypothetical protein